MKNGLLRDTFIVFATWFVIAYAWSRYPLYVLPQVLTGVGLIWLIGLLVGTASTWFRSEGGLVAVRSNLGKLAREGNDWAHTRIMDAPSSRYWRSPTTSERSPATSSRTAP
jgi:hypothetical protein